MLNCRIADFTTFEPIIEDDLVQESKLVNQYKELTASAKIEFQGETLNLSGIRKYTQDSDRQTSILIYVSREVKPLFKA